MKYNINVYNPDLTITKVLMPPARNYVIINELRFHNMQPS